MSVTLALPEEMRIYWDTVEGEAPQEKLLILLHSYIINQIRECEQEIAQYELKYGMTFAEFAAAWERDDLPNKWSHIVERDYMEWEGLVAEKQRWLTMLRSLSQTAGRPIGVSS